MKPEYLNELLVRNGAIITGSHLVLTSGKHSDSYANIRKLEGDAEAMHDIGVAFAEAIQEHEVEIWPTLSEEDKAKPVVILGPETLGRSLAEATAIAGGLKYYAWCVMSKDSEGKSFAEWNGKMELQELLKGSRFYGVDDMNTTGGSLMDTKELGEKTGGKFEGAIVVARRDQKVTAETLGIPWLHQLIEITGFNTYEAAECPLCAKRVPMRLRPGHGHEFIKNNPDYPVEEV